MVLWKSELIKKERAWGCSILSLFLQPLNWTVVVRAGLQQPYGTKEYAADGSKVLWVIEQEVDGAWISDDTMEPSQML